MDEAPRPTPERPLRVARRHNIFGRVDFGRGQIGAGLETGLGVLRYSNENSGGNHRGQTCRSVCDFNRMERTSFRAEGGYSKSELTVDRPF